MVAAPAPQPARTYLVFFDWDRADLTARARQVVAEAAQNASRVQVTRIEVNGYTDTSGTPQYNQGLSVRRARAVQAELIRDGVPANAIDIHGYGETHLAGADRPRRARAAEPPRRDHPALTATRWPTAPPDRCGGTRRRNVPPRPRPI